MRCCRDNADTENKMMERREAGGEDSATAARATIALPVDWHFSTTEEEKRKQTFNLDFLEASSPVCVITVTPTVAW